MKRPAQAGNWFACGLTAGLATLFRPESALLLACLGLVLALREGSRRAWKPICKGAGLMAAGLVLALFPWTLRNALTLRTFQPLAPVYAQDQGEQVPVGYIDWCKTWLWRYSDVERYLWPVGSSDLPADSLPGGAGDNPAQRQEELGLIRRHNEENDNLSPTDDREFESIASERRRAHPLRYAVTLPLLRSLAMWFTPRVEILPLAGRLLPLAQACKDDWADFSVTLLLFLLNAGYAALAFWGAARPLDSAQFWGPFAIAATIAVRTGFFACFTFPEPRYVLEVYPEVIALGALALSAHPRRR